MAPPPVRIHGNFLARAFRQNTVCWGDTGTRSSWPAWRSLLDRLCGTERAAVLAAMDVLKRRTDIDEDGPDDLGVSGKDVLQAYYTLKDQCMDVDFSEDFDAGTLVITGLDAKPITLTVHEDAIAYMCLKGWEDIAGLFDDAHQHAAQKAFQRLVCAARGAPQRVAFAELLRYARAISPPPLTWQMSSRGPAVFRVGKVAVPCDTERTGLSNTLDSDDTARLLCSLHYENQHVISTFHQMPKVQAKKREALLKAQISYLDTERPLVDALKRLGLHQHDDDGRYARELGHKVRQLAAESHKASDEDITLFTERSTRHAQELVNILSRYFNGSRLERLAVNKFVRRDRRVPVRPGPTGCAMRVWRERKGHAAPRG